MPLSGRTLGGSSSINGMIYVRGNPLDYDNWRDAYGCTGWGHADLLPYFLRAEDQQRGGSAWHGTGGPLRVEDQRYEHPLSRAWLEAAIAWGLPGNEDFNGAHQDGAGHYQVTQRGGRRWSAADAYLRPAMARPNLTVETGAHVTRLLLAGGRATGVRYLHHGTVREAAATREVVVACGAVRSPQLLLLSGIGPADDLQAHDLPVVVDAPAVGAGLQDHPMVLTGWRAPGTRNLWEEATADNLERWRREGGGPMASFGAEAGGFTRSSGDRPAPDLQFGAIPGPPPLPELGPPTQRAVGTLVGAVHVRSRGRVTLASADPAARPLVDPAYFAAEDDLEVLVAGVRIAREITAHKPLASITDGELMPGEEVDDDDRVREWVRATAGTMFHPTGTCAMGAAAEAVCDPELRVRGVAGLRVVDASVMPATPRGNTNAPTIAVAERAADLIRGDTPLSVPEPARELV
jgi:choline dehydrogenase